MTGSAFKTMVANHLNRTDLTSIIATMSAVAVKKLEREGFWFQQSSTTVTTTSGTSTVNYPSDFIMELIDGFKDTGGSPLIKSDLATVDAWIRYSASSGLPSWYAMSDKIYLYPIPDAAYALSLLYIKSLGFPGDSSTNAWTDAAYDLTFWATIEETWRYLRNMEEQQKAMAQKLLVLKDIRGQSGRLTGTGQVEYRDY